MSIALKPSLDTTAGTVTAANTPGATPSLAVSAPYTNDADGDNTLSYRYRVSAGTYGTSTNVTHAASPYSFTISGLTCGTAYDVEVTYNDPDTVTGTNPQTVTATPTNCTSTGTVTAAQTTGATPSIALSAPYTNDANANNTGSYRYRPTAGAWVGPTSLTHAASPYTATISNLTCGTTYEVEFTYADSDGVSGTATQTVTGIAVSNCATAGTPAATVNSCSQITVSAPFTHNADGDGSTLFESGLAAGGPWTTVVGCAAVAGATPRSCVHGGLAASTNYYYRVTLSDPDGVSGTAQQVIGPSNTGPCGSPQVTPGTPTATAVSCTRIDVSAPFSGDTDNDSTAQVEYNTTNTWPGTTACAAVGGASPRSCQVATLANNTPYYFRITFTDPDGVNAPNPQVIGPTSTLDCRVVPGAPTATATACDRVTVSAPFTGDTTPTNSTATFKRGLASGGPFDTTVCSNVAGASPKSCIDAPVAGGSTYYYQVTFADPDGVNGTNPRVTAAVTTPACAVNNTTIIGSTAAASSCNQITVSSPFTGDGDQDGSVAVSHGPAAGGPWTVGCASVSGPSPRQCVLSGLTGATLYYIRVAWTDPDGVTGTTPEISGTSPTLGPAITTPACGADTLAPTVLFLSPAEEAVVGSTESVKVQVFDQGGLRLTNPVEWSVDGGAFVTTSLVVNANYTCGASCAVYQFTWDTTTLPDNGAHYLTLRVTDLAGNVALRSLAVSVQNVGGKARGAGTLLRRSHGSQLCIDCHNLASHSSQATGGKYGNWAIDCLTCHTPHRTRNLALVREEIRTPGSGKRTLRFEATGGAVANSATPGTASYANEDNATQADGACQACHTKTKNAGGQARWRNAASGGNADTHYASAAASRCTGCHTHAAGFSGAGGACNSCHFAPPTVGKHGSHDQVGATPTDYTSVTSGATATQYQFACAKCHKGTHFSDSSTPHTVEVVFDGTTGPANPSGTYTADAGSRTNDPGVNGSGWYWSNGTCSNLYCHSNAAPLGGTDSRKTVTWNQVAALTCASCHNTQARGDSAVATDLSNAHGKHIQSTSGETGSYAFKCNECHAQVIRSTPNSAWALAAIDLIDKTKHVAGTHSVNFQSAFAGTVNQSAGSYSQAPGYTCGSTYCHSGGVATSAPFNATASAAVAWNGTATCRSCHGWDAAAAPTIGVAAGSAFQGSAKHANHMANASVIGTNYVCADCHNTVVAAGNSPITSQANHVNGAKNIAIATRGTWTSSDTTATCSNTYCHSTGQRGAANVKRSANWAEAAWAGNICIKCHGATTGTLFGAPDYANGGADTGVANSHSKHVDAATDCATCHKNTTTTGTSILAGSVHTNGVITLVFDTTKAGATVSGTSGSYSAPNYTSATCTNVACHGTNATAVKWGATGVFCVDCHGGASDVDNWNINDNTISKIATGAQWTTYGHGSATVNLAQGKTGIDLCRYCHDSNVNHKIATNPFRLLGVTGANGAITAGNFNAAANNGNGVCWNCHATGSNGVDPDGSGGTAYLVKNGTKKIDSYHYGASDHTGTQNGGARCWDCHDGHGDATNLGMVGSDTLRASSDPYGLTGTRSTTSAVLTTQGAGGYANTTTRNGVCQVCHTTTSYWRSASEPTAHNAGSDCMSCHAHNQTTVPDAFKGKGGGWDCYGCHQSAQGSRRALSGDFGLQSHHVRTNVGVFAAGPQTRAAARGTNEDCVVCHAEGQIVAAASADCPTGTTFPNSCTNPTYHGNGKIDLRNVDTAAATPDGTGTVYAYDKGNITGASSTWGSGNASWQTETSTNLDPFCLKCHDAGGAANISSFRISTETLRTAADPFWDGTTNITNNYDMVNRGAVVDIASRVVAGATSLDKSGEPRFDQAPVGGTVPDPPQGIYSRHAIRGQSLSVYETNVLPAARYTSATWNDTSVMGCADCHTTDGANGTAGNAHGSTSEYLLKDASGGAAEGTLAGINYVCFKCHSATTYEPSGGHTGNNGDFTDYTGQTGTARVPVGNTGGNIYAMACTNCHGGAATAMGDTVGEFGTIHGTSQILTVGVDGGAGTRQAYRFMNGNSMRYYDPTGWTGSAYTCYTLSGGDTWGGCTKHAKGQGASRLSTRNLKY